ncbi:integrase core domain-containing protein [Peptococcaceae bacterium]|nr:integrase core domain-containing protein [Peptococcaceae bacterium]
MVKKYKQKINALKKDKEKLAKKLGEVMVERDWAVGKLKSLDLLTKVERFFRTLKYEHIYPSGYATIKEAKEGISKYINTYNTSRLHSAIGYRAPDEAYNGKYYQQNKITS